ncbi:MAG TPA: cob(I)yrinic acid a,c-diamide adenosyltransferase [Desulfurivibrio alkaliphilus]|uniref:corrinoid adenosyltransferase n=1 Tax=Desulfurivibrio alkaliphilus TaxID=427923 RepID=A0A7C2XND4_9BACT|nr:cob(I)yrinic acid a,c-diamide adenosyltransferase [Desulfurivibrio alkaliphilus]
MSKGLLIVYTGHGKGKTSAAFGQVLRAAGQGLRVCVIQFVKARPSGELQALTQLGSAVELHQVGSGFSWRDREMEKFRASALAGWQLATAKIASGDHDLVVLDELTYLVNFAILSADQIIETALARPAGQHLLITGRDAAPDLIAAADLVTEMREIKHPFQQGIKAQRGIEF